MTTVKKYYKRLFATVALLSLVVVFSSLPLAASPYGQGVYGADVPYGSETSLAISTSGDVNIQITPTESGTLGTASNDVTVTSTDVVGYQLYLSSLGSSDMVNGPSVIPASANVTPGALATNTWGYNTTGGSTFTGATITNTLIKSASGPFTAGDTTTVTYGIFVDNNKAAGDYVTTVVYTAVPQTQ